MRAINHALTGAIIGLTVSEPLIAAPLALASHYVCDVIPHFGVGEHDINTRWFTPLLIVDAVLCVGVVVWLFIAKPKNWLLSIACAFLAAAPDLLSARRYFTARAGRTYEGGRYERLASKIQWYERPPGAIVEIIWFVGGVIILDQLLH